MKTYWNSTTNGKEWQAYASKSRDGFVQAVAVEGEASSAAGFDCFTYVLHQARIERLTTTSKRLTAKAEANAIAELRQVMFLKGLIR